MMVAAPRECPKCRKTEEVVRRLEAKHPGSIAFRKVSTDSPEAEQIGVVMPPMLLVDGILVSAGRVPDEAGLDRLIAVRLAKRPEG